MLRSDHSAFSSPREATVRSLVLRAALGFAALAFAAGCSPEIGDECTVSTDCSATGDRLCDITEPGGYCTVFNCEPDACPDDAACINFGTTLSGLIDPNFPNQVAPACLTSQGNSPYQRSFCMASCSSDGDCRAGYKCLEPSAIGGVKVDYNRSNPVCAVPRSGPPLVYDPAVGNDQVCLGSDAGAPPVTSSGGSGGDAGLGGAGESSGGVAGSDSAGAGG